MTRLEIKAGRSKLTHIQLEIGDHIIEWLKYYEDMHNPWLYCFTNPLEIGTRV